ncbi:DUF5723 family protein [Cytophagaceae bacterium DM2B3-1]|uniref:DUF5723 family protein n=1 Tax=Xanthocytophaga flava TaxID=3048013 RepID=A0ABT7CD22_9BACT|nr:DUF5723 family protein [Xanthocytophaga flavus]MDJ1491528.1 DUF5723 family protein [Xanthocytophaga flavus]
MKKILPFLLAFAGLYEVNAQQTLGLSGSNYSGTHGIFLNPASIADSRMSFYLDLFSAQVGASNNYVKGPIGFSGIEKESFTVKNNGKDKYLNVQGQAQAFSFMVKMSPVHSLALTNRVRYGITANNVSEGLAKIIWDSDNNDYSTFQGIHFNLNMNAYKETGLTYARVIKTTPEYSLKGGITINRVAGITSAHITSKEMSFSSYDQTNEQGETETILDIQKIQLQYAYVQSEAYDNTLDNVGFGTFFGKGLPGKGWGVNLGATFEKLEESTGVSEGKHKLDSLRMVHKKGAKLDLGNGKMTNNYKYRVGFSLMDVGSMRYSGNYVQSYDITRTNTKVSLDSLDGSTDDIAGTLNNALGVTDSEKKTSFSSSLPTAIQLSFDYHIKGKLYVNAVWVQSLKGKYALGMRQPSLLAVTPRLEMRWFEVAVPVGLTGNYKNLTIGTHIKAGILHFGSDNIAGLLGMGKTSGLDVYTGIHIPIFAKNTQSKSKSSKREHSEGVPTRE